jgi:hypothetical protein
MRRRAVREDNMIVYIVEVTVQENESALLLELLSKLSFDGPNTIKRIEFEDPPQDERQKPKLTVVPDTSIDE